MGFKSSPHLGRTAALLARHVEVALCDVDLSMPQYRILIFLDQSAAVASSLAVQSAVTRPSVTAVVDGLVHRGLVERRSDPSDRRRVEHLLTDEGRKVLAAADKVLDAHLSDISGYADGLESTEVLHGLDGWRRALEGHFVAKLDTMKLVSKS